MLGPSKSEWNIEALNRAQWERVHDDVGTETLFRFASLYLDMLADRIETIEWAVEAGAVEHALRVLADLRTSSAMLGVERLAHAAAAAEVVLQQPAVEYGALDLRALHDETDAVIGALIWALRQLPEPTRPPDQGPVGK
ncbi:MAG TPA: Hpt domain-containing protein [Actinocrinis sp.]|nr:Hpt domain-containing protein [Actinocrinis sp.]